MDIVFFDGVCGLCNAFVDFLLRHDRGKVLFFSPLQGRTIRNTKAVAYIGEATLVFIKGDKVFIRSKAAIESVAAMGGAWVLCKGLLIIPGFIRDAVYKTIAKYRYKLFGKKDTCRVPVLEEQSRFLE